MSSQSPAPDRILISADAHVQENDEMWARIPEPLKKYRPTGVEYPTGGFQFNQEGRRVNFEMRGAKADPHKEFRDEPSGGVDLDGRKRSMAREGVDANVVFPNDGLGLGIGDAPAEFRCAHARAYNDWVWEVFASESKRFKPVGLLPVDNVEVAVAETEHCLNKGFVSVEVPVCVPWRPYFLPYWEPLWSLIEESDLLLNFHIFSGNLAFGADFAWVHHMPQSDFDIAKKSCAANEQAFSDFGSLSSSVMGMACGMSPILHLIGGGVLERHPRLRFIVTEAECGWIPWLLHQMDQLQQRFQSTLSTLSMKPSEYFRRQGAATFTEDPVAINNIAMTGSEQLLWSNDYPHTEGTYPNSRAVVDEISATLSQRDAENIFFRNAARLYGFDLDYLEANKAEIERAAS
jgi:predicted TIM-barrel fold metal-dependent hydrolase